MAYIDSLSGFSEEAITAGIRKFLRGECDEYSKKFCPHPPELASIVRSVDGVRPGVPSGRIYRYRQPASKILERNCTKEWARQLVSQGVHPRGSIWCPGALGDNPQIGDLYGPDDQWRDAVPLSEPKPQPAAA